MAANTVIIGAGPAGLTAAYELRKRGHSASVLEGSTQVGGLSRTENYRGYRFDIGGHRFFSKVPLINDLWQEILGEEFLLRPRMSRMRHGRHPQWRTLQMQFIDKGMPGQSEHVEGEFSPFCSLGLPDECC